MTDIISVDDEKNRYICIVFWKLKRREEMLWVTEELIMKN